jgi:hypothetical protein
MLVLVGYIFCYIAQSSTLIPTIKIKDYEKQNLYPHAKRFNAAFYFNAFLQKR